MTAHTNTIRRHPDLFNYAALTSAQIEQYGELGYLNLGRVLTDRGLDLMREQVMVA